MKMIFCTAAAFALAFGVLAGGGGGTSTVNDEYCAELKDGKVTVTYMGKPISGDMKLNDGSMVKIDGTIVHKDGTRASLKEGQCITFDGKLLNKGDVKKHDKMMKDTVR